MIFRVDEGLYYDNEKMYIIKGDKNKEEYLNNYNKFDFPKIEKSSTTYPTLIFLSSTSCNLRCKYCFADDGTYGDVSKKTNFSFEDYVEIFDTVLNKSGGINAINFFGGEPVINIKEIEKFVEYVYDNYNEKDIPSFSISTNGTIMNENIKRFLKKYNIAIGTSLDGIKEHNDINRVGCGVDSVYDSVVETLDYLSDYKVKKGLQFTINHSHILNYQKGDYIKWAKELESLEIDFFEIVAVTSDLDNIKINIKDENILNKYKMLCNDIADYCLKALINGETTKVPRLFIGVMLSIIKRTYQKECGAGKSFSFSPDKRIYPCHVCADNEEYGFVFDENYLENIELNEKFKSIKDMKKEGFTNCNECIAKSVCAYFCKALMAKTDYSLLESRCMMMTIFTESVIKFLANDFNAYKTEIEASVAKIYEINNGVNHAY